MKNDSRVFFRVLLGLVATCALCIASVQSASAYDAVLAWKPVKSATGYRVYVADRANLAGARNVEVTNPTVA